MSMISTFHRKVGNLLEVDIWDQEYSEVKINEESKRIIDLFSHRYRGSVRLSSGMFPTSKEYMDKKKELLGVKIP